MALITNNISGSSSDSWRIGITGSVRIANPGAGSFPEMPGTDVDFFVSGSRGGKGTSGVSVFGGDAVISGSLTVGTGSVTITSNEIQFLGGAAKITSGSGGLTFFDSDNSGGVTLSTLAAGGGGGGDTYWSSVTAGEAFTTGSVVSSGSITVKDGGGTAKVILATNGDITGSNALLNGTLTTTGNATIGGNIVSDAEEAKSIFVNVGANNVTIGSSNAAVVIGNNLQVTTNVTGSNFLVNGTEITATTPTSINLGNTAATVNVGQSGTGNSLNVRGNLDVDGTADVAGTITLSGNSQNVTHSGTGNLTIASTSGNVVVESTIFSGSDVTIPGNLTVQGTTTTIDTTNLLVKDPVILMGTGSVGPNANGGIAIFSGSSGTGAGSGAPDLVFGRVDNDTWGVGALVTNNGTVTSLTSMNMANMRAAAYEVNDANYALRRSGTTLILSGGAGSDVAISGSQNIALIATDFTLKRSGTEMITFSSSSGGPLANIANITAKQSNVLQLQSDASDGRTIFGKGGSSGFASVYTGSIGSNPNVGIFSSQGSGVDVALEGTEVHFVAGGALRATVTSTAISSSVAVVPSADVTYNLGSPSLRWANIYTGDLHLKNDRGDYTLIEEEDFLSIRFNKTGKRYKFLLEPVPELDE